MEELGAILQKKRSIIKKEEAERRIVEQAFLDVASSVVSKAVLSHISIKELKDGVLFIESLHSTANHELYFSRYAILSKLRARFPNLPIKDFRIRQRESRAA